MPSEARARRVGERIQEELAILLIRNVADPRLNMVTITEVDVDRELAYATIYVTASGGEEREEEVLEGMESASGYFKSELATRIQLRAFPQLRFRWDVVHERGQRIEELLDSLKTEGGQPEGEASEE
ncbi:MAG: 30S ribosome-binding factor RbfA [Anaerolineales bacterium]